MQFITRQMRANVAADLWKKQYMDESTGEVSPPDKKKIYLKLLDAGQSPSPDKVNEIIGNESWTWLICTECDASVNEVMIIASEVCLCNGCMSKAVDAWFGGIVGNENSYEKIKAAMLSAIKVWLIDSEPQL